MSRSLVQPVRSGTSGRPGSRRTAVQSLQRWFSHPAIDSRLHESLLQRQHRANLACQGVLEANYGSLGSDFRGCGSSSYTLSYMSPMGGWAVLEYALRHDPNPSANLRLGYASLLRLEGLPAGRYGLKVDGQLQPTPVISSGAVNGADAALDHVGKHIAVFAEPPRHVPTQGMPDGPLLGNGDVGVAPAGPPEAQRFYVGKNDFWRRNHADASIVAVGVVSLSIPALRGATYRQEQDLARADEEGGLLVSRRVRPGHKPAPFARLGADAFQESTDHEWGSRRGR